MSDKLNSADLRMRASAMRSAAASQEADLISGNFPQKIDPKILLDNISRLRREADDLDSRADQIDN